MNRIAAAKKMCGAVLIVACVVGCAGLRGGTASAGRPIDSASGADPSITPFRLDVVEELNDGERLIINGRLTPKSSWSPDEVIVRLLAVNRNGEQRVSFHKLRDVTPPGETLAAGVPQKFTLSLPSEGITNYQLEALWGQDAAPYLGNVRASMKAPKGPEEFLALRNLEVHRIPDGSCASPDECLVKFSIRGEFFNSGGATIRDVVLVAGFSPADKLDLPNQILENERRIEVRNVGLGAGATKPFRLTLEKYVPASDQIAYQPVVRITSFESE